PPHAAEGPQLLAQVLAPVLVRLCQERIDVLEDGVEMPKKLVSIRRSGRWCVMGVCHAEEERKNKDPPWGGEHPAARPQRSVKERSGGAAKQTTLHARPAVHTR